jgi:hypothetical protein
MLRYLILARSVFSALYDEYVVTELDSVNMEQVRLLVRGPDLDDWIEERSGLYDLLDGAHLFLSGQPLGLSVDFGAFADVERGSPADPFPRKKR